MKTKFSKVVSLFMSAIMTVSALTLPGFSANAETNESTEQTINTNDSEIQYGGLFGSMLSDEIDKSVQDKQEAAIMDYTVYKVYHDPESFYVGVDYHAKTDCTLFIGFYNDEGTELITSVTKDLEASDEGYFETYTFDSLPDHYLIKCFILGKELKNPLSKPCVYNRYTKQMQEILAKTTDDFEEENLVNLDNSDINNFFVLQDGVIDIIPTKSSDIYKGTDENGNYIFENAVEIATLQKGDKAFVRSSPEMVAFIVDEIEIDDNNTAVIYHGEAEIDDFIAFMKIDSNDYKGESFLNEYEFEDENVSYLGHSYDSQAQQVSPDDETETYNVPAPKAKPKEIKAPTVSSFFKYDLYTPLNIDNTNGGDQSGSKAKVAGSIILGISLDLSICYDFGFSPFLSIDCTIKENFECNFTEAVSYTFEFKNMPVFSIGAVSICLKPSFTVSLTGKFYVNFYKTRVFAFSTDQGITDNQSNPEMVKIDGKVMLDFKVSASATACLVSFEIVRFSPYLGLRFDLHRTDPIMDFPHDTSPKAIKYTLFGIEWVPYTWEDPRKHNCNDCYTCNISIFVGVSIKVSIFKLKNVEWNPIRLDFELGFFHINEDGSQAGKCENYSRMIGIKAIDSITKKPISGASVFYSTNALNKPLLGDSGKQYTTQSTGEANFFIHESLLENEAFSISVCTDSGDVGKVNIGSKWQWDPDPDTMPVYTVYVTCKDSALEAVEDDTEEDNDDDDDEEVGIIIGVCGDGGNNGGKVFFVIYPDENNLDADIPYQDICYIFGNGEINQSQNIPSWIKKVVVIDPETKLSQSCFGGRAFESIDLSVMQTTEIPESTFQTCSNLIEVILPPNTETIGALAFNQCSRLEYVYLPDSITSIGQAAFSNSAIKSFTAPKNLKEIGFEAFKFTNLREIKLNDGLQFISLAAFMGKSIKYLNIPSSVNVIALHAFRDWDQLTTVIINSDFDAVDEDHDNSSLVNHQFIKYYDNVSDWIFEGCYNIKQVTFNEGVTTINPYIFQCKYNLEKVNFPSTLKTIGRNAFLTTNLTDVNIPESVTSIGYQAFFKSRYYKTGGKTIELKPFKSITINNPNCEIGESIVPSGYDVIVYGHDGSTAQAFAEKNSNTFISLDAPVTTTTVATTTTTKATTVVTTNISPDKECVMVAVNDTIDEKTSANRILNSENLRFFDQNTADENGVVSFAYVPNNDETWSFMFISEAVDNIVQKTFGAINDLQTVSETLVSDDDDTESLSTVSGDANGDGTVDMADAVLIMQALANPNKYGLNGTDPRHITENGLKYADTDGDGLTVNDAQHIQLYLLGKISSLG